jgi:hypothetical protein
MCFVVPVVNVNLSFRTFRGKFLIVGGYKRVDVFIYRYKFIQKAAGAGEKKNELFIYRLLPRFRLIFEFSDDMVPTKALGDRKS